MFHTDRLTFQYAGELKAEIQRKHDDYDEFKTRYKFDGRKKTKFINWLEKQNIEFSIDELEKDWDLLGNRILAETASSIWGKEYLYRHFMEQDPQVQSALTHFNEARDLFSH